MDHTFDHIGPITRTFEDNALVLEVLAGPDWRNPQWRRREVGTERYSAQRDRGIEQLRIGVVTEALDAGMCAPQVLDAFADAERRLTELGGHVEAVSIPL